MGVSKRFFGSQKSKEILALLLVFMILLCLPVPYGVTPEGWRVLAIFVITLGMIVLKTFEMGTVTFLAFSALLICRALSLDECLSKFSSPITWLVLMAFFISKGFMASGLGSRVSLFIASRLGTTPLRLAYAMILSEFLVAPLIPSNTARAGGLIYPIAKSLGENVFGLPEDDRKNRSHGTAFLLYNCFQGHLISSSLFLTAMPGNPMIVSMAMIFGFHLSWMVWFKNAIFPAAFCYLVTPLFVKFLTQAGSLRTKTAILAQLIFLNPLVLMSVGAALGLNVMAEGVSYYIWLALSLACFLMLLAYHTRDLHPVDEEQARLMETKIEEAYTQLGPISSKEKVMAGTFLFLLVAWTMGSGMGLDPTAAAMIAVTMLLVMGVLSWETLASDSAAWTTFMWLTMLFTLSQALKQGGVIDWFAFSVGAWLPQISWLWLLLALTFINFYIHYFFASLTSHISTLFQPLVMIGLKMGVPMAPLIFALTYSTSLSAGLTNYGTASGSIIYGAGYWSLKEWWVMGFLHSTLMLCLFLLIGLPFWLAS